ncbi:hypothetical protein DPSP01_008278 [Paraphaeosphaeria sporulosa]|uniref:Anaphase-promoting complex, subunit CDC26 n=1 Tax=Paraphaeosphaeria sporulosa TaxID=1460663 RepID=A0A177BUF0_9PLEO|nr:uncharacterized protein CC84DRAFT_1169770 [Paraphaeosphaeria sporulosa]OAF99072.1 hypothetical protein CC84DRAFT_1169770 [Paraphaeosphaeria sporulosa]
MLRRPATTITLTSTDLDAYEANRQRKVWEKQQQQAQAAHASNGADTRSERSQQGSVRPQQRSQKDRIMGGQTRHGH